MSLETEQVILFQTVKNNWSENKWGPIQYENQSNPKGRPGVLYTDVEIVSNPGARVRESIGGPKLYISAGFLHFTIYSPQGTGALQSKKVADFINSVFDEIVLTTSDGEKIHFDVGSTQALGTKDNYFRTAVMQPFRRFEAN